MWSKNPTNILDFAECVIHMTCVATSFAKCWAKHLVMLFDFQSLNRCRPLTAAPHRFETVAASRSVRSSSRSSTCSSAASIISIAGAWSFLAFLVDVVDSKYSNFYFKPRLPMTNEDFLNRFHTFRAVKLQPVWSYRCERCLISRNEHFMKEGHVQASNFR